MRPYEQAAHDIGPLLGGIAPESCMFCLSVRLSQLGNSRWTIHLYKLAAFRAARLSSRAIAEPLLSRVQLV